MGFFGARKPKISGIIKALGLEDWYLSLTEEQQKKLKEYSGQGNELIRGRVSLSTSYLPYTQKRFLSEVAINILERDPDFAILVAKKGLTTNGKWIDQHFLYNTIIEAFMKKEDYKSAKEYCLDELKYASQIRSELTAFDGKLPPSIPFRDTLIDILINVEENYTEARGLVDIFVQKEFLTREESTKILEEIKIAEVKNKINKFFKEGKFNEVTLTLNNEIKEFDDKHKAEVYKMAGNLFLENKKEKEAFEYLHRAQITDPFISGVKNKVKRLAKKLGIELNQGEIVQRSLSVLKEEEKSANDWWSKRDLANKYVEIGQFDKAWSLYNQALLLAAKNGISGEGIYSYMAKMLEKEKRYKNAIFHYLLACKALLRYNTEPAKYISQGIDRCLKKLDVKNITHADLYALVKKRKNASEIRDALDKLLKTQRKLN